MARIEAHRQDDQPPRFGASSRRVPSTEPLKGLQSFCRRHGINLRYLYRETLTDYTIDAICGAVGIHPSEVYADWGVLADRLAGEAIAMRSDSRLQSVCKGKAGAGGDS